MKKYLLFSVLPNQQVLTSGFLLLNPCWSGKSVLQRSGPAYRKLLIPDVGISTLFML